MVESHYDTNEGDEEDQESNKEEEDIEVSQIESVIEDASDILELAWQNLEVARVIYSLDPNEKLKLADIHLLIGDISMESDNMQQAVNEYEKFFRFVKSFYRIRIQGFLRMPIFLLVLRYNTKES